jgi:hypothetical protein
MRMLKQRACLSCVSICKNKKKRLGVAAARLARMHADAQAARLPQLRQYLYFCTSKTRKLSTESSPAPSRWKYSCVSVCTFVLVKQVNCVPNHRQHPAVGNTAPESVLRHAEATAQRQPPRPQTPKSAPIYVSIRQHTSAYVSIRQHQAASSPTTADIRPYSYSFLKVLVAAS